MLGQRSSEIGNPRSRNSVSGPGIFGFAYAAIVRFVCGGQEKVVEREEALVFEFDREESGEA